MKGNKYPLAKDQRVLANLWQICTTCKSYQHPLRNLSEGRQDQGCGAGTETGWNRIHLGTLEPEPEPYSEYGSGSGYEYKEMKQTTQKN
jgi:hypothetical protein